MPKLRAVGMTESLIFVEPGVLLGKPVIRGTRITVDLVVRKVSEGAAEADVLEAYPHLTREGVRAAALAYAADTVPRASQYRVGAC